MGIWAVSLEYVDRPSPRWAALAGLLWGGVVLVHGTEMYTLGIVLTVIERIVYNPYPNIGNPLRGAGVSVGALLFLGLLWPIVQEVLKPLPALFLHILGLNVAPADFDRIRERWLLNSSAMLGKRKKRRPGGNRVERSG